jgi:DNA-binding CsgD family transcriptional regulator
MSTRGQRCERARAVELLDDGPRPLSLASALEDLGVTRVQRGATQIGLAALGRALTIYAQSGGTWDASRVRRRLRAHGVHRRLVTAHRAPTGWAAMTDSELAVAQLVAQGLTNREVAQQLFVSPHTVSSHLRHVFAKLDVKPSEDSRPHMAVCHHPHIMISQLPEAPKGRRWDGLRAS